MDHTDEKNNMTCFCVSFSASEPVQMNRVKQGSLSAVLDNGIHLSYSFYGPTGEYRGVAFTTHTIFSLFEA